MPASRDQIAVEFRNLVVRHGYRRAAVEDIARTLHISKKTIYDLFPSKEALYRYSVDLWAREQRQSVEARLSGGSALSRIEQLTGFAFADARRGFAAASGDDASEPPAIIAEVNARVFGPLLRDLIDAGNATGEFHVEDPETTAAFLVAIGTEAMRWLREDPSRTPEAATLAAMRRLLVDAAG